MLRISSYAGTAGVIGVVGALWVGRPVWVVLAAAAVAVLAWGWRAHQHARETSWSPDRGTARSLALVTMLLGGTLVPVGGVAAQTSGDAGCQITLSKIFVPGENTCASEDYVQQAQNQTRQDLLTTIKSTRDAELRIEEIYLNYLNQTSTRAWNKGQAALARAIQNGSNKSAAKAAANQAIEDYYAGIQENMLRVPGRQIYQLQYVRNVTNQQGLNKAWKPNYGTLDSNELVNITVRLMNGTKIQVPGLTGTTSNDNQINVTGIPPLIDGPDSLTASDGYFEPDIMLNIPTFSGAPRLWNQDADPDPAFKNSAPFQLFDSSGAPTDELRMKESLRRAFILRNQLQTQMGNYSGEVYDAVENGTLNASDILAASTLATQYSQDYNSTQNWNYLVGYLSQLGLSAPDLNSTSQMDLRYYPDNSSLANETFTGLLMSQEAPNGTWESGVRYDASSLNGTQLFVTLNGTSESLEKGDFEILEIRNETGDVINQTTTKEYSRQALNVSELKDVLDRQFEARIQIQDRAPTAGGGGPLFDGLSLPGLSVGGLGLVVIGLGALLFLSRDP